MNTYMVIFSPKADYRKAFWSDIYFVSANSKTEALEAVPSHAKPSGIQFLKPKIKLLDGVKADFETVKCLDMVQI